MRAFSHLSRIALCGGSMLHLGDFRPHATSCAPAQRSSAVTACAPERPAFSFGVIADVQWADDEDGYNYDRSVVRRYRGAFRTLERAVEWWRSLPESPAFIAQLGDLLDGINVKLGQSTPALEAALSVLSRAPCRAVNSRLRSGIEPAATPVRNSLTGLRHRRVPLTHSVGSCRKP